MKWNGNDSLSQILKTFFKQYRFKWNCRSLLFITLMNWHHIYLAGITYEEIGTWPSLDICASDGPWESFSLVAGIATACKWSEISLGKYTKDWFLEVPVIVLFRLLSDLSKFNLKRRIGTWLTHYTADIWHCELRGIDTHGKFSSIFLKELLWLLAFFPHWKRGQLKKERICSSAASYFLWFL